MRYREIVRQKEGNRLGQGSEVMERFELFS